ncbi:MAG: hypothetical protein IPM35_17895 [Myxococcales bacterium]|nr:hypothetical protein [Myxococcales bacterium]
MAALASGARAEEAPGADAGSATPPVAAFPDPVELPPQPPPPPGPKAADAPASAPEPAAPPAPPLPPAAPAPQRMPQSFTPPPAWPAPDAIDEPELERRGYGEQTLLVDGLSLVVIVASGGSLAAVGGLGYLLGPPIVHAAHGHAGKPFASLGLRVGMPIGGAVIGCAAEGDSSGDFGCLAGAASGFALGIVGAIILDATVIAREDVPRERPPTQAKLRVYPRLTVTGQKGELGIFGQF